MNIITPTPLFMPINRLMYVCVCVWVCFCFNLMQSKKNLYHYLVLTNRYLFTHIASTLNTCSYEWFENAFMPFNYLNSQNQFEFRAVCLLHQSLFLFHNFLSPILLLSFLLLMHNTLHIVSMSSHNQYE